MQNSVCIKHTIGNTQSTLLSVGFFICHLYITKENNLADIFYTVYSMQHGKGQESCFIQI